MKNQKNRLPKDFLFSVANQLFQGEGARKIGGRSQSLWDEFTTRLKYIPPAGIPGREIDLIDEAADIYHKYETDARIMERMNINSYRTSIDWSRICAKNEDDVNGEGIKYYDSFFRALKARGVTPMIILYQWDMPLWAAIRGGFTNREILDWLRKFTKVIYRYLGKYATHFISSNESSNIAINAYGGNLFPPAWNDRSLIPSVMHLVNMFSAIAKEELEIAKQKGYVASNATIGMVHDWHMGYAMNPQDEDDCRALDNYNSFRRDAFYDPAFLGTYPEIFLEWVKKNGYDMKIKAGDMDYMKKWTTDFVGWNPYLAEIIQSKKNSLSKDDQQFPDRLDVFSDFFDYKVVFPKKYAPREMYYTKWDWLTIPESWNEGLIELHKKYHKPIFIAENGLGDFDVVNYDGTVDDYDRAYYIKQVYDAIIKARAQDVNCFGYAIWSYCDVFSPTGGYRKQYGLVRVDMNSPKKERYPKISFCFLKQIAKTRGDTSFDHKKLKKDLNTEMKTWDFWYK